MITSIQVSGLATFAAPATLNTEKKVNLIYGLNGTGKSTVCRFLKNPQATDFSACRLLPAQPPNLYVYNDEFIRENFYESEKLKGIFSLSKENKDAEQKIEAARKKLAAYTQENAAIEANIAIGESELQRVKTIAENTLWEIKTSYTGGDRVLEYCLEGLKAKKESLFQYIISLEKPTIKPDYSIESLKADALSISAEDAPLVQRLFRLSVSVAEIETDATFMLPIIGNQESILAALINKLENSDWVREGLKHIEHDDDTIHQCPFCQEKTVTKQLINQLREFFDEGYEQAIRRVRDLSEIYEAYRTNVRTDLLTIHPFNTEKLTLLCEKLNSILADNTRRIKEKLLTPSAEVHLEASSSVLLAINLEIDGINARADAHNEKLRNKSEALSDIRVKFWSLMRDEYDHVISRFIQDAEQARHARERLVLDAAAVRSLIAAVKAEISETQKETVNIDQAIKNINAALIELGIDDFSIEVHDETLYRLKRRNSRGSDKFSTLSEGEKMIITLLYFCELCKGRTSTTDTAEDKIVVFDDPISSLSHIYVFNVGHLLKSTFFKTDAAKQVFIFTHSLYFFYELAKPKKRSQEDEDTQALFRITKSNGQSRFVTMKYDEIQNDYQAYWQVVNDSTQHPALIANCMRNIVDYFFGFVEKIEYANVFQKPCLRDNRFQAFCRYMNRESHSFGQNIYDLKEFDYDSFKDGLRLVFEESGYSEHYNKMKKI